MAFRYEAPEVWPLALEYVDACLIITDSRPQNVQFSVGEQLRRSATSIIANIAESSGRGTRGTERNFYDIARGSVAETIGLLALCQRRTYLDEDRHQRMYNRANIVSSMLWGLIKANEPKLSESATLYSDADHALDEIFASSLHDSSRHSSTEGRLS